MHGKILTRVEGAGGLLSEINGTWCKELELWSKTQVQIPALPLTSSVTLGPLFYCLLASVSLSMNWGYQPYSVVMKVKMRIKKNEGQ